MLQIPLQPVPAQTLQIVLDGQNVQLSVYKLNESLFMDINSNGVDIVDCVQAHDADPLVCIKYTGFLGNLVFIDTQGSDDPYYSGLGTRFVLIYLTEAENIQADFK